MNEIKVEKKPVVASGHYKKDYDFLKQNDLIIKKVLVDKREVDFIELAKKYPDYFTRIVKYGDGYIIEEKLDCHRAAREYSTLENKFIPAFQKYVQKQKIMITVSDSLARILKMRIDKSEEFIPALLAFLKTPQAKPYQKTFIRFFRVSQKVCEFAAKENFRYVYDIHSGQFGYDKNGKLKIVDL